jgi:hypothetical protein
MVRCCQIRIYDQNRHPDACPKCLRTKGLRQVYFSPSISPIIKPMDISPIMSRTPRILIQKLPPFQLDSHIR